MNKIIAIHQPNFLPWIGYFYKMTKSDIFVLLDNVQFSKNSYQNRTKIKTSQGPKWLTIPVIHHFGQLGSEVRINNKENWRDKHMKTFEMNYKRTTYFSVIYNMLKSIYYKKDWNLLIDINIELITNVSNYIGIKTEIIKASSLNINGASTDLLIDIIKSLNGNIYLSGFGGANYQDDEKFNLNGISLKYSDFIHPVYPQLWGTFCDGLSIIDLLFNCGDKSFEYLNSML